MAGPMFYQWIFQQVDSTIHTYIVDGANNMAAAIGPVAATLFGIYIMLWGMAHLSNKIEEPVMDGTKRLVIIAVILALALNAGRYTNYVVNFVTQTPVAMASVVANGNSPTNEQSTAKLLDGMLGKGFELGDRAKKKAGVLSGDFGMYIVAFICYIGVAALTLFAAVMLMIAKVAMAVLLVLGPAFILLLMFESTKRFFSMWLGQIVNFMLTYVLAVAVMSLLFRFVGQFLDAMLGHSDVDSFAASAQLFVMCGIGVLVLRQVPAVASALGGGIAMSTLGGFGAAMNPLRRLSGALGGAGRTGINAAGRKAGSAAWNSRAAVATRRGMANAFRRKNTLARI